MTPITLAAAVRAVLAETMQVSDEIVLLGDSVGRMGGVAGTCHGLLEAYGDERVLDLPVADRGTLAAALGMALAGKRPVVELSGTNRLVAGMEILAQAAAIASRGDFSVPLVLRVPYGTEAGAADVPVGQAAVSTPGLTVVCASDAATAAGLLRTALGARAPVVILEPRAHYEDRSQDAQAPTPFTARTLRPGTHLTVAAWGGGLQAAVDAATALSREGIEAEVIDLVALHPIDHATLGASVRKTGRLVVVHPEDPALADAARAVGLDEAFLYLEAPLKRASASSSQIAAAARDAVHY